MIPSPERPAARASFESARRLARLAAFGALIATSGGCSLVSLKSPEKPLSTRDLNTRILIREYSARFIGAVAQTADQIGAASEDSSVRLDALRWKIAAAAKSERAASQMAPLMSLLDSWALSTQMSQYLATGKGQFLFGSQQPAAATLAAQLAEEAQGLAQRLLPPVEYEKDARFIDAYTTAHPIESLDFARGSVVESWTHDSGAGTKLVDSLGTVPEALADAGDRLRMYGEIGPAQLLWQGQLAAQEFGISGDELKAELAHLDERIASVTVMVNATPKMVGGMVRNAGVRFDSSWAEVMRDVHSEELTASSIVATERQATTAALDAERTAMAADAQRIADQVIRDTGEQVRKLVREALILVIVLVAVVLGIPFAAGYFVGRAHRRA